MKTTKELADSMGLSVRVIQKYCKALGIKKTGRDYLLGDSDIKKIKKVSHLFPGRPRGLYD